MGQGPEPLVAASRAAPAVAGRGHCRIRDGYSILGV